MGQAMEFLMTYGWAILVVLVAVGALAYFGVFNLDKFYFIKDDCDSYSYRDINQTHYGCCYGYVWIDDNDFYNKDVKCEVFEKNEKS